MQKIWKPVMGLCCSVSMASLACGTAYAQENQIPQESQSEDEEFDDNVIIVTATRRAQDVQDIPIAVTAVSQEQLDRQGIFEIRDISAVAPSFSSTTAQIASGSVVLRVRGVGTTSNNIGFESAVGIFIDGAYQSRPGVALAEFVDIERVEVLRGPQGTLFGRNTSAGALNITNKRPDLDEFGGFGNITYGNFNQFAVQGAVNVPIVEDTVALRFTGAYRTRDGILTALDSAGNDIGDTNDIDRFLVRGQLGWEFDNGFKGRIIGDYNQSNSSCCGAVQVFETPFQTAGLFAAVGLPLNGGQAAPRFATTPFDQTGFDNAADDRFVSVNALPVTGSENWGVTGEFEFPLSDDADVIFITSYRDFTADEAIDSDFSAIDIFNIELDTEIQTFTAELRVQGEAFGGRLNYLVGGYFSDEQIRGENTFRLGEEFDDLAGVFFAGVTGGATLNPASPAFLGPNPLTAVTGFNPAGSFSTNLFTQSAQSWSIFTHNTFEVTDKLDFTFGLRYTDETKSGGFDQLANVNPVCPAIAGAVGAGLITGATVPAFVGIGCFGFTAPADLPQAAFLPLPQTFDANFRDDELIYTVNLAYAITNNVNLYGSFTHGIKAGGINLDTTAAVGTNEPVFESEEVDAFEVGLKGRFLDGALTVNLAGFHQEFSNFQVLEFTGAAFETFNVPRALTTGVEFESIVRPSDNWTFNIATTILNSRYPDDCAGDSLSVTVLSLCGNDLTNAAGLTAIAGVTYEKDITNNLDFFANAQLRFVSDERTSTQAIVPPGVAPGSTLDQIQAAIDAAPLIVADVQDSNIKINLRAGFGSIDDLWSLEFFVTNLTNEVTRGVTFNNVLRGTGAVNARSSFVLEPRIFGVTARTSF